MTSLSLLPGSRESLAPVPLYCRPPLHLSVNQNNPLLSIGLAESGDQSLSKLEPQESPIVATTSLNRLDKLLLTVQDDVRGDSKAGGGLVGLLTSMCSYDEMVDKQRTSTANDFERLPATLQSDREARLINRYTAVKSFQRSDANKVFKPGDVRPLVWCRKSVHNILAFHLSGDCVDLPWHVIRESSVSSRPSSLDEWHKSTFDEGNKNHGFTYLDVYNFVRDRFRSVWQDLTVQHCPRHRGFIESLEISFRFLIFSEALLCRTPAFDTVQNGELMNTSLDKLMGGYQDVRFSLKTTYDDDPVIRDLMEILVYKSPYEAEFWAYRILLTLPHSLENSNALLDIHRKIPPELINEKKIQLALASHRAFRDKNACRYFKILRKADFLMAVLMLKYSNLMRVVFLKVLIGQFTHQRPLMPFNRFSYIFGFDDEPIEAILSFCQPFGIKMVYSVEGVPAFVNMHKVLITPTDLHPKKSRCRPYQSSFLLTQWKLSGHNRQTLLDPDFPTSPPFHFVLSQKVGFLEIPELGQLPTSVSSPSEFESPVEPPTVEISPPTLKVPSTPRDNLSPFGAALFGLTSDLSKSPLFNFPSSASSKLPPPPEVQIPLQDSPPPPSLSSPTTRERRLSFAFEGLVTPPSSDRSTADHHIVLIKPTDSGNRRAFEEPKFGVSDSEISENEAVRTSEGEPIEEVQSRRKVMKRKHPEFSKTDETSDKESVDDEEGRSISIVQTGAKRRLRESPRDIEIQPPALDETILVPMTADPTESHSVPVTTCLDATERSMNSSKVIDVETTLGFCRNRHEFNRHESNLLLSSLESVCWVFSLASSASPVLPVGRRASLSHSYGGRTASSEDSFDASKIPSVSQSFDSKEKSEKIANRHSRLHHSLATSRRNRWRISDRFAAMFGSRPKDRHNVHTLDNSDEESSNISKIDVPFSRRFLELLFLQLSQSHSLSDSGEVWKSVPTNGVPIVDAFSVSVDFKSPSISRPAEMSSKPDLSRVSDLSPSSSRSAPSEVVPARVDLRCFFPLQSDVVKDIPPLDKMSMERVARPLTNSRSSFVIWALSHPVILRSVGYQLHNSSWAEEVKSMRRFLGSLRERSPVAILFCAELEEFDHKKVRNVEQEVHQSLASAWKEVFRNDDKLVPWNFEFRSERKGMSSKSRSGCFCVGNYVKEVCYIDLSKSALEGALSQIRYWVQLGITCQIRQALMSNKIDSMKVIDQQRQMKNLFPQCIHFEWKMMPSDSIGLLLISSWKRKVEELPDSDLPTLYSLLKLLPVAVHEMSTSVYLHPIFWGRESDSSSNRSVPEILQDLSEEVEFCCAELLESTEDVSASEFRTFGDFFIDVRRLVRTVVDNSIAKIIAIDPKVPLVLTFPFWQEFDTTFHPPWGGFPFPPQCYGGWNALASQFRRSSVNRKFEPQSEYLLGQSDQRYSRNSFGTPPRGRKSISPKVYSEAYIELEDLQSSMDSPLTRSKSRLALFEKKGLAINGSTSDRRSGVSTPDLPLSIDSQQNLILLDSSPNRPRRDVRLSRRKSKMKMTGESSRREPMDNHSNKIKTLEKELFSFVAEQPERRQSVEERAELRLAQLKERLVRSQAQLIKEKRNAQDFENSILSSNPFEPTVMSQSGSDLFSNGSTPAPSDTWFSNVDVL